MAGTMGTDQRSDRELKSTLPHNQARALILQFEQRTGGCAFPKFNNRTLIASQLYKRIDGKEKINAKHTGLCGPAAFLQSILERDPVGYVKYVIDLFEYGKARLESMPKPIEPSFAFRQDGGNRITPEADIIAMGSLRDSRSWFYEYHINADNEQYRGGTNPGELADWFRESGYTDVVDYSDGSTWMGTNQSQPRAKAELAGQYLSRGYHVCIAMSQNLEGPPSLQMEWGDRDHVALLTSPIQFDAQGNVSFTVFDDGKTSNIKASFGDFTKNFYGFVAAGR